MEILLLNVIAKGLDKSPASSVCGDNIRYLRPSYVIDIAAADRRHPGCSGDHAHDGSLFIIEGILVQSTRACKKPLVSMAVGPLGAEPGLGLMSQTCCSSLLSL